ncbi:MAG: hypothetical protein J6C33_06165 [Lachnospiraceae bacterium]|nr:hypothetical protein [Lachnospiraceae bacterium]
MKTYTCEEPRFSEILALLETKTRAHADIFNEINKTLFENTLYLYGRINENSIEDAFYTVFTKTGGGSSGADETALTASEIDMALSTEWNGESSADETALSAAEIDTALHTEWSGETSADDTALSAGEIETALST